MSADASRARVIVLIALCVAVLVYLPGMTGGFAFDDYGNILNNEDVKNNEGSLASLLEAAWSGVSGPLKRPVSMMSFALNYAVSGEFVAGFKLTNLVIHLANGILVFVFLRLVLAAHSRERGLTHTDLSLVAAAAATIWLLHPLNLTSVLYVVQRMTSLSALFSLAAMISYCIGRDRLIRDERRGWWSIGLGVPAFTALGVMSKENAVLTVPLIALIEGCFYRFRTARNSDRRILLALAILFVMLPAGAGLAWLIADPEILARRFVGRPFTLVERLLTESRVLWFYLGLIVLPRLRAFGLYHDDFTLSTGFTEPWTTAFSVAGIALAGVVAVWCLRRRPFVTFVIGWYLIGHALESSVIALELVHEHRNYLPSIGIIAGLCLAVSAAFASHARRVTVIVAVAAAVACSVLTYLRAGDWSDPVTLATVEAQRHPDSFRSVYELGRIQFGLYKITREEQYYSAAIETLERAAAMDRNQKRPLAALLKLEYARGREPKPEWFTELLYRYENTLFHASESFDLHQFVKCRAERTCDIPVDKIGALYHAALSNPRVPDYARAQLMVDLAIFYVNEAGDLEPAIALLDGAVDLFPREFKFRKPRAQIYLMAGRYDDVRTELQYLRSVPVWDDWLSPPTDQIDDLERILREAETASDDE